MKFLSVNNCKGGIGKSALTYNLAAILASFKKKVLILDVDPQANVTRRCGISNRKDIYEGAKDIFERGSIPSNVIIKSPISELPTLDLIPSTMALTSTEMGLVLRPVREHILKNYFDTHKDYFEKYDYIIADTAPNINLLNQNVLLVADSILLITECTTDSIEGCSLFIEAWSSVAKTLKIPNNIKGIVINKLDKRISLSKDFIDYVRKNPELKNLSFDSIIPENVQVKKSELEGIPLCIYDKKCAAYGALVELTKELAKKGIL